ncbi:MAG: hypothetical protein ISQ51_03350, partial [Synechococcus sp. BS307-5m-G37]|nr:hypothetical protein [Synechococcus sp. BS307-5m-G37]
SATGSEAELQAARAAVGMEMLTPEQLEQLQNQALILATSTLLEEGQKAVDADAVILGANQKAVDVDAFILEPSQTATTVNDPVEQDQVVEQEQVTEQTSGDFDDPSVLEIDRGIGLGIDALGLSSSAGVDAPGMGDGIAAMSLGDGIGSGQGAGSTNNTSNSSGSSEGDLNQQINNFLEGEGEAEGQGAGKTQGAGGDAQQAGGQGADGQGQGAGGEAALGEDQSPDTQRKRGLLLQPLMPEQTADAETKTPSTLLKNLSEGSVMGNNLLDALALGAGVLYALYAPKAVDSGKKGWKKLLHRFRKQANGGAVPIAEKNVLSVFAMKMPNGGERLMATRVGMGGIEVLAQQDLPVDVRVGQPGNDTQVDYGVSQLLAKLEGKRFDLALLGPKLRNQSPLVQAMAKESQLLNTQNLIDRLSGCSSADLAALQEWLNKPSTTPPESSPVFDLLNERLQSYGTDLAQEQASMSSLIELSVAMGWSQYGKAA